MLGMMGMTTGIGYAADTDVYSSKTHKMTTHKSGTHKTGMTHKTKSSERVGTVSGSSGGGSVESWSGTTTLPSGVGAKTTVRPDFTVERVEPETGGGTMGTGAGGTTGTGAGGTTGTGMGGTGGSMGTGTDTGGSGW